MMRLLSRILATMAVGVPWSLVACGDDSPTPADDEPPTRLVVEVHPRGPDEPARRRTVVDCTDGMRESVTCQRLERLRTDAFAPVTRDRVCTQVYGGPATAVVRGKLRGRAVVGRFSLKNGCEIDRWERFAWLIGEPPRGAGR